MDIEGKIFSIYVLKRPGLEEFLFRMSIIFEVVIYTASLAKYADQLIDNLDPHHYAAHRLFRQHCTSFNNSFVKDLSNLGRDLKNIIIVDNSPSAYALHTENGLPIPTWIDDKEDRCLYDIIPVLEMLAKYSDVRRAINLIVSEDQVDYEKAVERLKIDLGSQRTASNEKTAIINSWIGSNNKERDGIGDEKSSIGNNEGKMEHQRASSNTIEIKDKKKAVPEKRKSTSI